MQQKQEPGMLDDLKGILGLVLMFVSAMNVVPAVVLLRKFGTMGVRYPSPITGLAGAVVLALFPSVIPHPTHDDLEVMTVVWWGYMISLSIHRMTATARERTGDKTVMEYTGDSRLTGLFGCRDQLKLKGIYEPLLLLGLGYLLIEVNTFLSTYLMVSAGAGVLLVLEDRARTNAVTQAMERQRRSQQHYISEYKEKYGGEDE